MLRRFVAHTSFLHPGAPAIVAIQLFARRERVRACLTLFMFCLISGDRFRKASYVDDVAPHCFVFGQRIWLRKGRKYDAPPWSHPRAVGQGVVGPPCGLEHTLHGLEQVAQELVRISCLPRRSACQTRMLRTSSWGAMNRGRGRGRGLLRPSGSAARTALQHPNANPPASVAATDERWRGTARRARRGHALQRCVQKQVLPMLLSPQLRLGPRQPHVPRRVQARLPQFERVMSCFPRRHLCPCLHPQRVPNLTDLCYWNAAAERYSWSLAVLRGGTRSAAAQTVSQMTKPLPQAAV